MSSMRVFRAVFVFMNVIAVAAATTAVTVRTDVVNVDVGGDGSCRTHYLNPASCGGRR